ncbi:WhiB family transcriptional regulator [Nocardia farcinica]|uniref:WhiB family transcriptional regulator n=1 Tax=Nocardia farcinica TaxID=37329 RepID=UPI002453AF5C|nr:WhiB family transcriptional regulator [Nocardia farcinica]
MKRQWPASPEWLSSLFDARLVGAACAGQAPLFDAEVPGEDDDDRRYRLDAAARVCQSCPVLAECNGVARELGRVAVGVWAGRARHLPAPVGRPREGAA